MFTGQGASLARRRLLRFWSMMLSAVLAITLLQVAPPVRATDSTPLSVNLVARFDDTDVPAALLVDSSLVGTSESTLYRLDLVILNQCGVLEHINQNGIPGVDDDDNDATAINWTSKSDYLSFFGLASDLELVLDNLRIVASADHVVNCDTPTITAYFVETTGAMYGPPQGSAEYRLSATDPEPTDPPTPSGPAECVDYRGKPFADNILLDSRGYPVGCDLTAPDPTTPVISDSNWADVFTSAFDGRGPSNQGFTVRNGWACDDCSVGSTGVIDNESLIDPSAIAALEGLPLGFSIDFYGNTYDSVFVNSNGSLSFGAPSTCYDQPLDVIVTCNSNVGGAVIAPYAVDLDNWDVSDSGYVWGDGRHAEFFYWGKTEIGGKQAFVATWMNSKGYNDEDVDIDRAELWSTFQVIIQDTSSSSDPGHESFGSAEVTINYGSIQDSGNGYGPRVNPGPGEGPINSGYPCAAASLRCIAVGMGSNFKDSEGVWVPQLTSLTDAVNGTQFNGLGADEVVSGGAYPLPEGTYGEGGVEGRYVYSFGLGTTPDVATVSTAPLNLVVNGRDESIVLSWDPPSDLGGSTISSYTIKYRASADVEWETIENVSSAPHSITGLINGTEYEAKISAFNGVGDSDFSESRFATAGEYFQITSQETYSSENSDTYSTVETFVSDLVGPGITVSDIKVNGQEDFNSTNAPSFGTFTGGSDSVGIFDGIVMSPINVEHFMRDRDIDNGGPSFLENLTTGTIFSAIENLLQMAKTWVPFGMPGELGLEGGFEDVCRTPDADDTTPECANNTTSLDFMLTPLLDQRFLKFEYAIAGTENGFDAYSYPDGFALFVGGLEQSDNCAMIPAGAMEASSNGSITSATLGERYLSVGNLRFAGLSNEVSNDSSLNAEDISSVLSCVVDTQNFDESEPVHVTMVIANANDDLFSPAVFLKADSIRFDSIGIVESAIPNADFYREYVGHTFTSIGGTGEYTYSLVNGSQLPPGLSLSEQGVISGTPTASGIYTFEIEVTDSSNNKSTQNFTINVTEPVIQNCDNEDTSNFVLMFSSNAIANGDPLTDNTAEGEDANLRNALCTSYDVTVFDGGSYSVSDWTNALEGASALVFPEMNTGNNLFSTEINSTPLFSDDLLDYLREWNSAENPVIFTGSDTHLFDMQTMIGSELPLTSSQGGSGELSYSRVDGINDEAPESLDNVDAVVPMQFSEVDETGIELLINAGFRPIYGAIEGPASALVAVSSFSSESSDGHLVYQFGFDWYESQQNAATLAWAQVLSMAISGDLVADSGDRFLQGQYVEVGIAGNGRFGSSGAAPSGYNPRDPGRGPESGPSQRRIGFVSDRDKDGWGVGQDDGDFFIPGDPFEGFGVDIGGNSYFNNDEDTDIARLSEVTDTNSDRQQSTWTSEEMPNGLQVTQVAAVPVNDQRLDVTVTLTNNSGEALEDVYYARQVDNDANVYACQENEGGWRSLNKVIAQANSDDRVSLVSSIMMDDCNDSTAPTDTSAPHSYLGMISTHPDSVAALQGFDGFGPQQAIDFVNGVTEEECQSRGDSEMGYRLCLPVMIERGSQVFGDAGIGLGFDLGTIEAGGFKTITFSYILSANQAQDIIDQHNIDNDIVAPAITTVGEPALRALIGRSFESATSTWVENTGGSISYYTISPELPDGLSLNSETGDISGTPTATMETTSFTLTANNLAGSSSVSFALEIEESIDCRSNPEADLKVVLLRKISANPSTENNSTVNEIDTNIAQTLCRSSHIDLTLFRGGDGSPEAWDAALTGKDVLVLPATTFDLVGSNLMSNEALTWITIWMRQGGRVVVTDSSQHAIELERLLGLTQDPLDFMTSNDSHVDNNQAPTAMPERLVLSDSDNSSHLLLLPTGSHTNEMLDIGLDSINIYGTSIDLDQELISASAATQFGVDRGHVIQISSNYSGEVPSASWNKLLLASVYGTPTRYLGINEPDATWVLSGSELYWDEMNPAAIISLGNGLSRDAVRCVNVPSSPSIRKVTALGTEVKCGSYRLFDGITDSGVQIQLKRFFSANAAWLGSKVEISNLDTENTYRNSIYYGGSQGQNSTMQIEATNDVTHNLSNLNSYMQEPHWYVTSRGESISRDADGPEGKIVTTVLGPDNFASYGGSDRYSLPLLGNDEILSEKTMELDGLESRSFTFFTGLTEYEPGCDRLAVSTSKTAAAALNSQFDPDLRWPDFDEISFPELSTSECESYFDQVSGMSISQQNEVVSVSWPRLPNADMYELQFQLLGQDSWSSSLYQSSSEDIESIWNFTNLNEGAVYNFRIRPIEINRNSSSDNANGRWLLTDPGFTVETWSSPTPSPSSSSGSPSPSPSNSPSPSQQPVVNNAGPDLSATIVPQMIAQTAPGLPARLKRGKTVRFGMTAPSGLPLRVTSVGQCKTTAVTKRVTIRVVEGKKVKKKRVKMQTGWAVKATRKKGLCTVTFSNSGDATRSPLASAGTITVF